jgi:hypothetical protein
MVSIFIFIFIFIFMEIDFAFYRGVFSVVMDRIFLFLDIYWRNKFLVVFNNRGNNKPLQESDHGDSLLSVCN